jgi:trans-aconitate methyltransferase
LDLPDRDARGRASGAFRVDIGCGTGRLTRHLRHEDIAGYLGVDIIPEILQEAIDSVDVTRDFHLPSTSIAGCRDKTHHATSSKW